MKQKFTYLTLSLLLACLVGFVSCSSDDGDDGDPVPELTPEEEQLALLARTWEVTSVTVDNTATNAFDGLTLTLTEGKTFTAGDGYEPVWPTNGTFDFGANLFTIDRNDGVSVNIDNTLSETSMILTFNYDVLPGGRTDGILGDYVFQFTSN